MTTEEIQVYDAPADSSYHSVAFPLAFLAVFVFALMLGLARGRRAK